MNEWVNGIKKISGEIWIIFRSAAETWNPNKDDWWKDLSENLENVIINYRGTEFEQYTRSYVNAILNEIERRYKEVKNEGM